ncbi:PepSY-associated TM helix domain-containing protein [Porphyromonas sp. COT-290 OH3588]|uniref:PepSY-associated TM helix domain-containing protein n=1 Tax=Porphyromonas sp. COT-290 OH3588 TaxID=1515617 RepID=UPI00052C131C|nr:PepSY-associated TM helix domain-containing protein [Porphyromonas sp. COT-290 OH3588]KGN98928.1 hypothetical protein HQ48_07130 [Porphyromonas sp. COT-290 OH3588]
MKKSLHLKWWHRWLGITLTIPILLFALSGIVLNHRASISEFDVPRSFLPQSYHYKNWNHGAIRGAVKLSPDSILLYGSQGIWLSDSLHNKIEPYSVGLKPAEGQMLLAMSRTTSGEFFALSPFVCYRLDHKAQRWEAIWSRSETSERLSDMACRGDSLMILSRSEVFYAQEPYRRFERIELPAPKDYQPSVSTFKTLWTLHSGELFGSIGIFVVDLLGVIIITLCLTGVVILLCPSIVQRIKQRGGATRTTRRAFGIALRCHNKLGVWSLVGLLVLTITGTFLRPPLLISIIRSKHTPLAGTHQDSSNPWQDKLRTIRYDAHAGDWLLYTSDGFYRTSSLASDTPVKVAAVAPVSFMGINTMQQLNSEAWLVGSFSGLYYWEIDSGECTDLYTKQPYVPKSGMPDFQHSVAGFCDLMMDKPIVFDYNRGAESLVEGQKFAPMPEILAQSGRISLWHLALEVHTGRIYTFLPELAAQLFIFISGISLLVILLSGYIVYRRHHRKRKKPMKK